MSGLSRTSGDFADALSAVYGIATCRLVKNDTAAAVIVEEELKRLMKNGRTLTEAWALFFSAATVALVDMAETGAEEGDLTPLQVISQAALDHATAREPA